MRLAGILLAAGLLTYAGAGPIAAFEKGELRRSVGAEIVADGSAYISPNFGACSVSGALGGTCSGGFGTVANKGTIDVWLKITVTSDPGEPDYLTEWKIGDGASGTGTRNTTSSVAVGSSATAVATARQCIACIGNDYTIKLTVEGERSDILTSMQTEVSMTLRYT